MAKLLKTSGEIEEISPRNGKEFELEELQKMVGGYIEVVRPLTGKGFLVLNEEGLRMKLAPNGAASMLYGRPIVGDVVFCEPGEMS